ncbi:hypothetical protein ACE6H2_005321 [Prunus campanulata]
MHDVFLSFRGDDTRKGFTGHLYMTMEEAGINAFIDNQLRRGEEITAELVCQETGCNLAQAFQKHKERFQKDTDHKVVRWRAALTEASNLSGWDLRNTLDRYDFWP